MMGMVVDSTLQPVANKKYTLWVLQKSKGTITNVYNAKYDYPITTDANGKFEVSFTAKKNATVCVMRENGNPFSWTERLCYFDAASYMQRMNAGIIIDKK